MICFTENCTPIKLITQYKFFQRSSRRLLTQSRFIQRCKIVKKNHRTALMFVRAPKHFKAGKQRIVFFAGLYRRLLTLNTNSGIFLAKLPASKTLILLGQHYGQHITRPDILLSRVTTQIPLSFKILI